MHLHVIRDRYSRMSFDTDILDADTMYQAFADRDESFEGLFWVGVKTTGIFCRPGCPAKTPKQENVEYFPRTSDALAAGYRPCKRCEPMQHRGTYPDWLSPLMQKVEEDTLRRWTSQDLRNFGVDPARVRRWFQKHHGVSFLGYLRSRRLGTAFSRISDGSPLLEAARDADYDSVSGFCEALRRETSQRPKDTEAHPIYISQVPTPMGPIVIAADDEHVYLVEFWDRRMLETQFLVLEKRIAAALFPGETSISKEMAAELERYFAGDLTTFQTPLKYPGTEHQRTVWKALLEVPYGTTWTYQELANHIGKPKGVRSVARAVGENRFAIVIPCHRIIGSNGDLTGYGGGIWRKRILLKNENGSPR